MIVCVIPRLLPKKISGLALWPLLIVRDRNKKHNEVFINHERIHFRQQLELLVVPFYFLYIIEFFIRRIQYPNWNEAYRNISFEREAYANEKDLDYLERRSLYKSLCYLNKLR